MDVNRLRILVVDDQSSVRELLKAVLEEDGHEIETAPDGETAIAMLGSGFHDLVVMDIRMPGIDGVILPAGIVQEGEQFHDAQAGPVPSRQPSPVLPHPGPVGNAVNALPVERKLAPERVDQLARDHRMPFDRDQT